MHSKNFGAIEKERWEEYNGHAMIGDKTMQEVAFNLGHDVVTWVNSREFSRDDIKRPSHCTKMKDTLVFANRYQLNCLT